MLTRDVLRRGDGVRLDFFFGGSLNDGRHDARLPDRKDLGSNLLFRIGAEMGYQFNRIWAVPLFLDHDSNADTGRRNQGMNSLGLRVGAAL